MAIDRRKITMRSLSLAVNGDVLTHEATDYVAIDDIPAYVEAAQRDWQVVIVGDEIDHGPGGEDGDYIVPPVVAAEESAE